ncbi:GMC family oxidoreductase [Bradyrhizobium sp. BR13661]|nr:GMC family oxidoreductase [Bradyrhizobium sp. BR13661]MDH6263524.1 choline dehydrogenase-like flavoprotein [Bradyrhizobium sp. BR13661]
MKVSSLSEFENGAQLEADLLIVGAGPAGISIARSFFGTNVSVLIIESGGIAQDPAYEALNEVDAPNDLWTLAEAERRRQFHYRATLWSHESQRFGVRSRCVGGASAVWAGKSATFDPIDFERRPWVAHSGWPIAQSDLAPYLDAAASALNLGPNCYDERLWSMIDAPRPRANPDPSVLGSFFWQFARSQTDFLRLGPEFLREHPDNVRLIVGSTVTSIRLDNCRFGHVEASSLTGKRITIEGRACVVAAGSIENARLLLLSAKDQPGLTNEATGRYLMDHPSAQIASYDASEAARMSARFGFYSVKHDKKVSMYMRGLALSPEIQRREELLNCAIYMLDKRALDDPWEAVKRFARRDFSKWSTDTRVIAGSPGVIVKGVGRKLLQSRLMPRPVSSFLIDSLIRFNPNFVAQEFQTGGLPHKLVGLGVEAISEQPPDPSNRVTLSEKRDILGMPLPFVTWRASEQSRRTLARIGELMRSEFLRVGLSAPQLEAWVEQKRYDGAIIVDTAHTAGTTRMASERRAGVVDQNCQVFGISGLYFAGASVFPTSGHANPTLMIVAMALRLADRLKGELGASAGAARDFSAH